MEVKIYSVITDSGEIYKLGDDVKVFNPTTQVEKYVTIDHFIMLFDKPQIVTDLGSIISFDLIIKYPGL